MMITTSENNNPQHLTTNMRCPPQLGRLRMRRKSESNIDNSSRVSTPDPGKHEFKQLYSPFDGIRRRNDFRRRSVGGVPRRGPSEPETNIPGTRSLLRDEQSAKNHSAAFSNIPVNRCSEKNVKNENMSPERADSSIVSDKMSEDSMSDKCDQNIDIERALCRLSDNMIICSQSEQRLALDKLSELKHEVRHMFVRADTVTL